ncbi:MAG: fumarylacetoacetate hydrolase family protein [Chloroflexi bacterium]|nr:fumarylacetoacetate hydrolase family protein [Chloroflexota bacterium]
MKIVRFAAGRRKRYGILHSEHIDAFSGTPFRNARPVGELYLLKDVRLLAPCLPSKIVALGLNYRSHARELSQPIPENPLIFLKPPTAIIGHEEDIDYPPSSERVDFEGELAVVIGKRARRVSVRDSLSYVLGYACFNDVTARDLQSRDGQWTRAKGFDTFAAIGPCIETELDPRNVMLETYLNGELKQRGSTTDLVFPVPELVSFISHVMTLLPGDVIATGTPSGIGPMKPGDTIEIRIEPIGVLRNYVVQR